MSLYKKLARKPKQFLALTGLELGESERLLPELEQADRQQQQRRKKYQIAAQEYRNRDEGYDQTMGIVAGLVNLRAFKRISQRTGEKF